MMVELTHLDSAGRVRMVDVGEKSPTRRRAVAEAVVVLPAEAMEALRNGESPKGNAFETARIAGIQAGKRTSELIPLCHPLPLDHVSIDFSIQGDRVTIRAEAAATARTGVEMEALTAVSVAALTLYDMMKAVSKGIVIERVRLLEKSGGKSGEWINRA